MKLKEIFDLLTHGELVNMNLGGAREGEIVEPSYPRVATNIGLGLTELHKRFLLREGNVLLTLQPGVLTYLLDSKYLITNTRSREPVKYLDDTPAQPFEDNIFKIERVYDDKGCELVLNDLGNPLSLRTPGYRMLMVPSEIQSSKLRIVYRANHRTMTEDMWDDPENTEIDLPPAFLEALCLYVAARIVTPVGFVENFHEGNNYMARFEAACQVLDDLGLEIDNVPSENRFRRNGWV